MISSASLRACGCPRCEQALGNPANESKANPVELSSFDERIESRGRGIRQRRMFFIPGGGEPLYPPDPPGEIPPIGGAQCPITALEFALAAEVTTFDHTVSTGVYSANAHAHLVRVGRYRFLASYAVEFQYDPYDFQLWLQIIDYRRGAVGGDDGTFTVYPPLLVHTSQWRTTWEPEHYLKSYYNPDDGTGENRAALVYEEKVLNESFAIIDDDLVVALIDTSGPATGGILDPTIVDQQNAEVDSGGLNALPNGVEGAVRLASDLIVFGVAWPTAAAGSDAFYSLYVKDDGVAVDFSWSSWTANYPDSPLPVDRFSSQSVQFTRAFFLDAGPHCAIGFFVYDTDTSPSVRDWRLDIVVDTYSTTRQSEWWNSRGGQLARGFFVGSQSRTFEQFARVNTGSYMAYQDTSPDEIMPIRLAEPFKTWLAEKDPEHRMFINPSTPALDTDPEIALADEGDVFIDNTDQYNLVWYDYTGGAWVSAGNVGAAVLIGISGGLRKSFASILGNNIQSANALGGVPRSFTGLEQGYFAIVLRVTSSDAFPPISTAGVTYDDESFDTGNLTLFKYNEGSNTVVDVLTHTHRDNPEILYPPGGDAEWEPSSMAWADFLVECAAFAIYPHWSAFTSEGKDSFKVQRFKLRE